MHNKQYRTQDGASWDTHTPTGVGSGGMQGILVLHPNYLCGGIDMYIPRNI